jgi:CRISPR/Cas system CSM-associated protein Csm3 (group 7 of RAMP superfamily)
LGQGTRNGYGKLSVHSCKAKVFDLANKDNFKEYLNLNPSLNFDNSCLIEIKDKLKESSNLTNYKLELTPDSFFIFSAGYGDNQVDNKPITEKIITYENNNIQVPKEQTLIPASSIKGAISHRTAYHYNKIKEYYADKLNGDNFDMLQKLRTGTNNNAVYELFGAEEGVNNNEETIVGIRNGNRGKVIIDDLFYTECNNTKIFNHVAIDRFTGGAMDGALFSEKVSQKNGMIELNIHLLDHKASEPEIIVAFEKALKDVCKGLLPLGGMTTKGHGIFTGKLLKNKEEVFKYEN